jgi:hypothetical protein
MLFCNNYLSGCHQHGMMFVVQQMDPLLCQKIITVLIERGTQE